MHPSELNEVDSVRHGRPTHTMGTKEEPGRVSHHYRTSSPDVRRMHHSLGTTEMDLSANGRAPPGRYGNEHLVTQGQCFLFRAGITRLRPDEVSVLGTTNNARPKVIEARSDISVP